MSFPSTMHCRAPLLGLLIPLIVGIALPAVPLWIPIAISIIAVAIAIVTETSLLRYLLLFVSITGVCWSYAIIRTPTTTAWENQPPREVAVTLRIQSAVIQHSSWQRKITGWAIIDQAPAIINYIQGRRVYFSLWLKDQDLLVIPTSSFAAKGVLRPTMAMASQSPGFRRYLQQRQAEYTLTQGQLIRQVVPPSIIQTMYAQQRLRLYSILHANSPSSNPQADILAAMLLGNKAELAPATRDVFMHSGTMHLFAISGLHIGVIAAVIFWLLQCFRIPSWLAPIVGLSCLYIYVQITGGAPSAMRAFTMVAFLWAGRLFCRRPMPFPALVAAAIGSLIIDPAQLFYTGFQLSYTIVACILLYGIPLGQACARRWALFRYLPVKSQRGYHRWMARGWYGFIQALAISFSTTLVSTPLTIEYFSSLSVVGVLLNVLMIPIASFAICLGFATLCVGLIFAPAAWIFNQLAQWLILFMEKLASFAVSLPGAYVELHFNHNATGLAIVFFILFILITIHYCRYPWRPLTWVLPPLVAMTLTWVAVD